MVSCCSKNNQRPIILLLQHYCNNFIFYRRLHIIHFLAMYVIRYYFFIFLYFFIYFLHSVTLSAWWRGGSLVYIRQPVTCYMSAPTIWIVVQVWVDLLEVNCNCLVLKRQGLRLNKPQRVLCEQNWPDRPDALKEKPESASWVKIRARVRVECLGMHKVPGSDRWWDLKVVQEVTWGCICSDIQHVQMMNWHPWFGIWRKEEDGLSVISSTVVMKNPWGKIPQTERV